MSKPTDYMFGARKLVDACTSVAPDERVLIITDRDTDPIIPDSVAQAARERNAIVQVLTMENNKADSGEPPAEIAGAMLEADVIFTAVQVSVTHPQAVRDATANGARIAALTQWIPEMLAGGGIEADFHAIEPRVMKVAKIWDEGSVVRVTARGGTDITMDIRGRLGTPHAKTSVIRKGEFHPVPDIESPVSPVTGDGVIVSDASIPYLNIGVLDEPVTLQVKDGKVVSIEGGEPAEIVRASWTSLNDPNVYNLAEIGIGMNPSCRLIGRMLEDEGVATTCHFGIGTSNTLGGTVKAACHYDFIVHDPTIEVDGVIIMQEGNLLV